MPRLHSLVLAVLGCAVALPAASAFGQLQPERPRDLLRDLFDGVAPPEGGELAADHVMRFTLRGQELAVASDLAFGDGMRQLRIKGLDGLTQVQVGRRFRGPALGQVPYFELVHRGREGQGGGSVHTAVSAQGGSVRITRTARLGDLHTSVTLTQDGFARRGRLVPQRGDRVTLRVRIVRNALNPEEDLRLTAGSFAELLRKHAGPAAKYLAPIFRDLGQDAAVFGVDPQVAWQLFPDAVQADEAMASKVLDLVARLDAKDFLQREAAAAALRALGGPAILVLDELDRDALSAEQNTRIDAFLSGYQQLDEEEVTSLLDDPEFLLRCFTYSDAPPIRAAAVRALARLLARPVNLIDTDDFATRVRAAEVIREELPKKDRV